MNNKIMDRRAFLKNSGIAGIAACGLVAGLAGCGGEKEKSVPAAASKAPKTKANLDPCNDTSALTNAERVTRTTFKYEEVSNDSAKHCDICNFWQASTTSSPCGTCTLVKGPIQPKGSCMSWVAVPPKTMG